MHKGIVFTWSDEKAKKIKNQEGRMGVSFKDVVYAFRESNRYIVLKHDGKYKHQHLLIICIDDYAYVVPFFKEGNRWKLITLFPSRKRRKILLNK